MMRPTTLLRFRGRRGGVRLGEIWLAVAIVASLIFAIVVQNQRFSNLGFRTSLYRQRIKLPPSDVLKFVTLGYDNIYANWLWLQSIQAFGSGWITEDGTTEPIFAYFDGLTDVDPHFISAYRFANLIIGDNRKDFVRGQDILRKGVIKNPRNFDIPYLGVYNAIWQYDGPNDARWFASRFDRIPETPSFMRRLAEYIERRSGRYEVAFEFNARYYIEYLLKNNEIEQNIVERRLQDLLDKWNRRHLGDAIDRFYEANGRHPERMESLLNAEMLPPAEIPTIEGIAYAREMMADTLDRMNPSAPIPQEVVDEFIRLATSTIVGLPPDPYGTWYMIWGASAVYHNKLKTSKFEDGSLTPYLRSARDQVEMMNDNAMRAQAFIMEFYAETDGELPSDEQLSRFLGRDPLGGHYVYQRDAPESPIYGVFYSTSGRRLGAGQNPRMGLRGPGPFPFSIEPDLTEHQSEMEWALEYGLISDEGNVLYFRPGYEPWLMETDGEVPTE